MAGTFPASGSIDPRRFPFLVTDLCRHGATGSLKVDGPSYQKDLYFRGGRLLFGSSNDPRDQLGAILIEAGRLTPEQLEEVNSKVGPGNPLAKVLAESGLVTQQELTDAARLKVEQILGDLLGYKEGSFDFEDGVLPKGAVDLKLHTDRLVLAAVRRITDRAFVLGHLGSLEVVLTAAAEASPELKAAAGELLAEIDGQRTLKESIARTKLEEFDAAKVACALVFLGVVAGPGLPPAESHAHTSDDSPFFVSEPADAGLDLTAAARQAMGESAPQPVPAAQLAPPALAFDEPEPKTTPAPSATPSVPEPPPPPPPPPAPIPLAPPTASPPQAPMSDLGDESSERPLFPRIEPPSKSDMAAINALLAAPIPDSSPRRTPAARSTAPRFGPPSQPRRRAAQGRGGWSLLRLALVLVLGLAGGAAAWWYWLGPGSSPAMRRAGLQRTAVPTPPPPTLATPRAQLSPTVAPTAQPMTAPSAPAAQRPSPPPTTTVSPTTAAPVAAETTDGRALLRARRFAEAGRAFAAEAHPLRQRHTIQILVACSDETLDKTLQSVGSEEWFIIPVVFKGRPCQRLCWGTYETPAAAENAQLHLPGYFRSGGALPRVVPLAAILP
jgi:hypothetical protein